MNRLLEGLLLEAATLPVVIVVYDIRGNTKFEMLTLHLATPGERAIALAILTEFKADFAVVR